MAKINPHLEDATGKDCCDLLRIYHKELGLGS